MNPRQVLRVALSWIVLLTVAPGASGHALLHAQRGDARLEVVRATRGGTVEHWNAGSPLPLRSRHSDTVLMLSCPGCSGLAESGAIGADQPVPLVPGVAQRALNPRETRCDPLSCAWSPEAGRAPPISLA